MKHRPRNYIHTRWENNNPIYYCNDIKLTSEVIKNFKQIFNSSYTTASNESYIYLKALRACNYNSELWENKKSKDESFEIIYNFIKDNRISSSITPLLPFEIFMLNDNFKMVNFIELNAFHPGITLTPANTIYDRSYLKGDNFIYIAFGLQRGNRNVNFYFKTSKSEELFEVNNNIKDYKQAIKGKLNYISNN